MQNGECKPITNCLLFFILSLLHRHHHENYHFHKCLYFLSFFRLVFLVLFSRNECNGGDFLWHQQWIRSILGVVLSGNRFFSTFPVFRTAWRQSIVIGRNLLGKLNCLSLPIPRHPSCVGELPSNLLFDCTPKSIIATPHTRMNATPLPSEKNGPFDVRRSTNQRQTSSRTLILGRFAKRFWKKVFSSELRSSEILSSSGHSGNG